MGDWKMRGNIICQSNTCLWRNNRVSNEKKKKKRGSNSVMPKVAQRVEGGGVCMSQKEVLLAVSSNFLALSCSYPWTHQDQVELLKINSYYTFMSSVFATLTNLNNLVLQLEIKLEGQRRCMQTQVCCVGLSLL